MEKNKDYQITIKFDNKLNQIFVEGSNLGTWMDLGLAIEGLGVLMAIEKKEGFKNPKELKTTEDLVHYICDYIGRVSQDYEKSFKTKIPKKNNENNIPLEKQVDVLAKYLMEHFDSKFGNNESAIEMSIRLLNEYKYQDGVIPKLPN